MVKIGRVVGEKKTQDDRRRQTITIPIGQQLKVSQVILKKVMVWISQRYFMFAKFSKTCHRAFDRAKMT